MNIHFAFTNQSFHGYIAVKFNTQRIRRESKINLTIIDLGCTNEVDNDNDYALAHAEAVANTEIFDIAMMILNIDTIEEIKLKVTSIWNKTQNYNEEQGDD